MVTVTVTPNQDAVQLEIQIAAPPDRSVPMLQWWGQKGMYRGTNWTTDVRPGGQWRSEGVSDTDGSPFNVSGEYLEVDPPRTLAYTWVASWTGSLKTVVRWTLEPVAGGTRVHLHHTGFAQAPGAAKDHRLGWQRVTGWMKAFVEKGTTVGDRPSPM